MTLQVWRYLAYFLGLLGQPVRAFRSFALSWQDVAGAPVCGAAFSSALRLRGAALTDFNGFVEIRLWPFWASRDPKPDVDDFVEIRSNNVHLRTSSYQCPPIKSHPPIDIQLSTPRPQQHLPMSNYQCRPIHVHLSLSTQQHLAMSIYQCPLINVHPSMSIYQWHVSRGTSKNFSNCTSRMAPIN